MMSKSVQKTLPVKDDEKFLEGINLVTGDKIDYARHMLTETQVNALCVSEKISKVDKFLQIMTQGQKIQKWSLFENITLYVENVEAAEKIFTLIEKNYSEYEEFISIMGEGLSNYLKKCLQSKRFISKKVYDSVFRIMLRTVTSQKFQGSQLLADWMASLTIFFSLREESEVTNKRKEKLSQLNDFINGSFSMNTLPQRRKTALEMINALIEESQQIQSQSHSKILFFNNDLNPTTRLVICSITKKILTKTSSSQIWKCVTDYYFTDKSLLVKQKAFEIISTIYFKPNADTIFHQFDSQKSSSFALIVNYLPKLIKTFEDEIKSQPMIQLKLFSLINRLLKDNMDKYITKIVQCYKVLIEVIPETVLISEIELKKFNLDSVTVIASMIDLSYCLTHLEFREDLKRQILKGLRYHEFYIKCSAEITNKLIDLLELNTEEDIGYFILMFAKQIQNSQWKNIVALLGRIEDIKFYQSQLQKIIANVLKIYSNCPYFMLDKMNQVILRLLLVDRKNMEVYLKIRQKCLGSKNWMLRRNFIKLYAYFKRNGSFELNRSITPLVYKNIVNQKNSLIKLEFVRQFIKAYPYLDPSLPQQKISVKEVINRFSEDKDQELALMAKEALLVMKNADQDFQNTQNIIQRNKDLLLQESLISQVISEARKHVKTEKMIVKPPKESRNSIKKGSLIEAKTVTTFSKVNHIEKSKEMPPSEFKPPLLRNNSSQNKKEVSKFFAPKKSRF